MGTIRDILDIIEQARSLFPREHVWTERIFTTSLKPLYEKLHVIHTDYMLMLEGVRRHVGDVVDDGDLVDSNSAREAIESLRKARLEFEPVRIDVSALARATMKQVESQRAVAICDEAQEESLDRGPVHNFCSNVIRYFPPQMSLSDGINGTTTSTAVLDMLEIILLSGERGNEYFEQNRKRLDADFDIGELISETLLDRTRKFRAVSDAYAKLEVHIVGLSKSKP